MTTSAAKANRNAEIVDRLEAENERLRAVVIDMLSGLAYLRAQNKIPYGFGINRLEQTGRAALLPAVEAMNKVERLRAEVRHLGEIADVCTYDTLKEVCGNCRCQRRALAPAPTGRETT